MSAPLLEHVKRAARAKARADAKYRAALIAACLDHSYPEVAAAAGVSRQAVRQLVERAR